MSEQAKFDMTTSEKEEQETVTFDDSSTNNSTEETQKVEVKADKNDRVGKAPTPEKPKSKGKNKLLLPIIGGTVGTLVVFGGIFAFLMSMDNDALNAANNNWKQCKHKNNKLSRNNSKCNQRSHRRKRLNNSKLFSKMLPNNLNQLNNSKM